MIHSAGNFIWIGIILLCLEVTWSQGKPAGDDSDDTLAKRQQQQQQHKDQQFNFNVGDKNFVLVYTVPGVTSDQAREWCQKLRNIVDIDADGWPIYLRGDLPSSNETLTKMGEASSNAKHSSRISYYFDKTSELDEFRYALMYIDYDAIEANSSGDKLLVSPQVAKPGNEAGNEAGKCVYSSATPFAYEKIETKACDSQNTRFVCQMEKYES